MKWDSIKSRLLVMTTLCVLGMGLMTINQQYYGKKLRALNDHNVALHQLQRDLLQLRRHEKDFLLRRDEHYLALFDAQKIQFVAAISTLNDVIKQYELSQSLISDIAVNTEHYAQGFKQLVMQLTEAGLSSRLGISGELYSISAQLGKSMDTADPAIADKLTRLKYLVLDYQLTLDPQYPDEMLLMIEDLVRTKGLSTETIVLLERFKDRIHRYGSIKKRIGITESSGLRGEFRDKAHQVEADLEALDNALQPILQAHREQATWYSTAIAVLTSVALILLLIKSFVTFHRSFANFVLFFYRCKRQYQRIDPRSLGFSEFRSLAALANEMVESRREIERRLANLESGTGQAKGAITTD
ncbi:chemotaxis protein [Alteromonas gilva]|uniref:Chemotaxis protein n=1 Tax=Alteromonas gilva TaxID=2987522 RepID=A0ABT5L716_9ALTE|nr:chemotaxis protein [Alteromonas gilva]MDC8832209.1 chemotaxis protein [Alteromonas gilva]